MDDFSEDGSIKIIKKLKSDFIKIDYFSHTKKMGQSMALISGIKMSKSENIITLDGDGQNKPNDINELIKIYLADKNIKLVGGIREKRDDTSIKIIASKIANKVRSYILNDDCLDTGCGLKIFEKNIFLQFPYFEGLHRFLPALYKGFGHKCFFTNVSHRRRIHGVSKYGVLKRAFNGIYDIYRVKKIINNEKKLDGRH